MSEPSVGDDVVMAARDRLIDRFGEPTDLDDRDVMRLAWQD